MPQHNEPFPDPERRQTIKNYSTSVDGGDFSYGNDPELFMKHSKSGPICFTRAGNLSLAGIACRVGG
jgi:hypothetical protein